MGVVPYSRGGTNEALRDLLGGRVHAVIDGLPALKGALQSDDLKALAIMSREPSPALPNTPVASRFIPGLTAMGWQALAVAKGTPEPIVRQLSSDLQAVLDNPELKNRLLETGSPFQPLFGPELRAFIEEEEKLWWPQAKKYGAG